MTERNYDLIDKLYKIGQKHNATVGQTALAWVLGNPAVTSAIVGANSVDQLLESLRAADIVLHAEDRTELDELSS